MNLETLKKFDIAFAKRRKELEKKMYEQLQKDVMELLKLESAKVEAYKAYVRQLEKVEKELECPACHKLVKVTFGQIKCPHCGLSTGEVKSIGELFGVWLGICLLFAKNNNLAQTLKDLQSLGGVITIGKADEATSEEIEE